MNKKAYFLMDVLVVIYGISFLVNIVLWTNQMALKTETSYKAYLKRQEDKWVSVFRSIETCTVEETCTVKP